MMNRWEEPARQSILWLENQRGTFAVHAVGSSPTSLVSAAIGDLDGDGRAEILAGSMYIVPGRHRVGRVTCWVNTARAR
jgi:hypothetical protein